MKISSPRKIYTRLLCNNRNGCQKTVGSSRSTAVPSLFSLTAFVHKQTNSIRKRPNQDRIKGGSVIIKGSGAGGGEVVGRWWVGSVCEAVPLAGGWDPSHERKNVLLA